VGAAVSVAVGVGVALGRGVGVRLGPGVFVGVEVAVGVKVGGMRGSNCSANTWFTFNETDCWRPVAIDF
jgi:hypothetical protein